MTIKQYAENRGITPAAVYSRLKDNNIAVSTLVTGANRELTEFGIGQLDSIYKESDTLSTRLSQLEQENRQLKTRLDQALAQVTDARSLQARLEETQHENEILRMQLETAIQNANDKSAQAENWHEAFLRVTLPRIEAPEEDRPQPEQADKGKEKEKKHRKKKKNKNKKH